MIIRENSQFTDSYFPFTDFWHQNQGLCRKFVQKLETMNTLLSLLALLFILQSCEFDEDFDDRKDYKTQVADTNKHARYDEIEVPGAADLVIQKGDKHRVVLKGNSNHFKYRYRHQRKAYFLI